MPKWRVREWVDRAPLEHLLSQRARGAREAQGGWSVVANLKVGKTMKALANLTTTLTPPIPLTPWGFSPQAKRLLSLFFFEFFSFFLIFAVVSLIQMC